jgi:hypothetical protein
MSETAQAQATTDGLTEDTFFFRKKDLPVLNEDGTPKIGTDGKPEMTKRNPLKLRLPYVNTNSLIELLQNEETSSQMLSFFVDLANDVIYSAAQDQVNSIIEAKKTPTQDTINLKTLDLFYLATQPKAVAGRGIPKELWAEFKTDFIAVITEQFGVSIDGATKASKLIADDKFQSVKTAVKILETLKTYLANWFDKTSEESKEKYAVIFEQSMERIDAYTSSGEQSLLDAIK